MMQEHLRKGIVLYIDRDGNRWVNGEYTGVFLINHFTPEQYNNFNDFFTETFNPKGDISR